MGILHPAVRHQQQRTALGVERHTAKKTSGDHLLPSGGRMAEFLSGQLHTINDALHLLVIADSRQVLERIVLDEFVWIVLINVFPEEARSRKIASVLSHVSCEHR